MARQPRRFEVSPGKREQTPIFTGLFGPSGSGKTYSALELATGIQSVVGGEIVGIDTENKRMLHYANDFNFKHIDFQPPFGSLDYLDVLQFAVNQYGAKTIIVDSMSHEHEGDGGLIASHEAEMERMAGSDFGKRERVKMLAWNKPKQNRRALLNGIVRLQANVIFCFRAKSTSKPIKNAQTGKQEVVAMGYMPIAGEEFVFEMTLAALLSPGARGVPTFFPENEGERMMAKLPKDFMWIDERARRGQPLDRKTGAALARWASGVEAPAAAKTSRAEPEPQDDEVDEPDPDHQREDRDERREPERENPQAESGPGYEGI